MPTGDPRVALTSSRRGALYATLVATALHALVMVVTTTQPIFLGRDGPLVVTGTLQLYFGYASRAVGGDVPYRDYVIEYPFLAFVLFLVPRLFTSDFRWFQVGFAAELLAFDAAAVYLVARRVVRDEGPAQVPRRLAWYTLFFASLCPLLVGRYDLAPTAVAFAAADWWFGGQPVRGGVAAAVGALLKIFPGLVALPAVLHDVVTPGRRRWRGLGALVTTLAAGSALWWAVAGPGVLSTFRYHGERGLEVESLYAGLVFLAGSLSGRQVPWVKDHDSFHVAPEWGALAERFVLPLQVAALVLVLWRFRRTGMADGLRYAGATILAVVVTAKVLSPQFMIWLIPFMVVLRGETGDRARRIFLLACVVTTVLYPIGFLAAVLGGYLLGILLLNYRNLSLLVLLWLLLYGRDGRPPREFSAAEAT
jgi:hypothetical protein